nr:transposase [Staphylococcus schleiferi]
MYGWKVLRFYRKYEDIIAYTIGTPQFNNGAIEGINQKVKLIKRVSYGYRNFYNFKNRIFIIFRLYKRSKKKAMPLFNSEIA